MGGGGRGGGTERQRNPLLAREAPFAAGVFDTSLGMIKRTLPILVLFLLCVAWPISPGGAAPGSLPDSVGGSVRAKV